MVMARLPETAFHGGCKEGLMHTYEIHVITPDSKSVQVHAGSYTSDFAVIRRARALVGNGQHVEVRRLHLASLEAVAVGALLVGGDE